MTPLWRGSSGASRSRLTRLVVALGLIVGVAPPVGGYAVFGPKWPLSPVYLHVNTDSSLKFTAAQINEAVTTAIAPWNALGRVQLVHAGSSSATGFTNNGVNAIWFSPGTVTGPGGGALAGQSLYSVINGNFIDSDIAVYENAYSFYVGSGCSGSNALYMEDILVHEIGHLLGINHTTIPGATMNTQGLGWCDKSRLTLEADDLAAMAFLYPKPGEVPPQTTTTVPVTTTVPSGSTPSPDGTRVPPAPSLVDALGRTWTLVGTQPKRNGSNMPGVVEQLCYQSLNVWSLGTNKVWYRWFDDGPPTSDDWRAPQTADPCGGAPPVTTTVPPTTTIPPTTTTIPPTSTVPVVTVASVIEIPDAPTASLAAYDLCIKPVAALTWTCAAFLSTSPVPTPFRTTLHGVARWMTLGEHDFHVRFYTYTSYSSTALLYTTSTVIRGRVDVVPPPATSPPPSPPAKWGQ